MPRDLDFPGFCNPRNGCNTCTETITFPPPVGPLDFGHDEIGHLSLVPRNDAYKGYVLIWTVCTANPGYVSHVFNPLLATSDPLIVHPAFVGAEEPFCSGHAWVFDENEEPRLLTVGGSDGFPAATEKVYWFDAATLTWSGDPVDLSGDDANWYPSIVTYGLDSTQKSAVAVIGGSPDVTQFPPNSVNQLLTDPSFPGCPPQFDRWWTLTWPYRAVIGPPPVSPVWVTRDNAAGYKSHQYPRGVLLSQNYVISIGHEVVICEDTMIDLALTQDWGGNAVQVYDLDTHEHLAPVASLDPNALTLAGGHQDLFGLNSANVVLQHTLKPGWQSQAWPTSAAEALARYDLDRVFVLGGLPKINPLLDDQNPRQPVNRNAHLAVLELEGAAGGLPGTWSWREKARPLVGRTASNAVLLPDGRVLFVGGSQKTHVEQVFTAELFDPGSPTGNGSWKSMKSRPDHPVSNEPISRNYHSVASLLPGGEVALMGGVDHAPFFGLGESMHSVDVFKPPYWFYPQRPTLTGVPDAIRYPTVTTTNSFCVQTNKPDCILRACLMGVGSVTHHFDYGQRYVELMVRQVDCGSGNIEVFPPPGSTLVPPGYYMLFLVDVNRLPSTGVFVKVDY